MYEFSCYFLKSNCKIREIITGITSMVEHYYKDLIQPKENIEEFLKQLKAKGVKMCIATANDYSLIKASLVRCNLDSYFDKIITCSGLLQLVGSF